MTFFSYRLAITPTSPLPLQRLFSVKSFISFGCQPLGWCHLGAVRSPPPVVALLIILSYYNNVLFVLAELSAWSSLP